ncbi:MAG: hypothetical protein EOP84_01930 [Verrucomicrobiaceae bacterium]|nr:MAG: hypothetical protein EOP84_01930 [Verrucomicrobiaceae bacterium]
MTAEENEHEARFYDGILRRVLWGDEREEVMRSLEVNGVPLADANRIYQRAFSERISAIRGMYLKRTMLGLLLIAIGCGCLWIVYYMTEGFTVWSTQAILIPAAPAAFGAWKFLSGLVGILTASGRTGPVSNID